MRLYLYGILFCMCIPQLCSGALSPLYQSIEEIQTILRHEELLKVLPQGQAIVHIQKVHKGYLVCTPDVQVLAEIVYPSTSRIGKQEFSVMIRPLYSGKKV
jgi:hypothetical protein